MAATTRSPPLARIALAAFAALLAASACRLVDQRSQFDPAQLQAAAAVAAGADAARLGAALANFNQPRHFLGSPGALEDCRAYLHQALAAAGVAAVADQTVVLDAYSFIDADSGRWTTVDGPFQAENVVAVLPGSDPGLRPVLVGAHYDTVQFAPGADDNGSGCCAALECARLLAATHPKRTIVFAFFAFEETGLQGSRTYADSLPADRLPQRCFILDAVGFTSSAELSFPPLPLPAAGDFLAAVGSDGDRQGVCDFQTVSASLGLGLPVLGVNADANAGANLVTTNLLRSDHWTFWGKGVPAILLTDTANFRSGNNYHQPGDSADTVDLAFLRKVAAGLAASVYLAAAR